MGADFGGGVETRAPAANRSSPVMRRLAQSAGHGKIRHSVGGASIQGDQAAATIRAALGSGSKP
jgi:hypothetical protein